MKIVKITGENGVSHYARVPDESAEMMINDPALKNHVSHSTKSAYKKYIKEQKKKGAGNEQFA